LPTCSIFLRYVLEGKYFSSDANTEQKGEKRDQAKMDLTVLGAIAVVAFDQDHLAEPHRHQALFCLGHGLEQSFCLPIEGFQRATQVDNGAKLVTLNILDVAARQLR
jgi:hypothetical protein